MTEWTEGQLAALARADEFIARIKRDHGKAPRGHALDMAILSARTMGIAKACAQLYGQRHCRCCGCTENAACNPACWWVEEDLCSACAPARGDRNG